VLVLALGCGHGTSPTTRLPDGGSCDGASIPDEGFTHVDFGTPVTYRNNPPASGNHWPCWTPYGVASAVVHPEAWVHNLEHGAVVLLFQCADATSCPDALSALTKIDNDAPDAPGGGHRIVVTADPTLPTPFAAVAWDYVLSADSATDESAFLCFAAVHEGHGREDISADGTPGCQ
jgi:hypothetical protein